MTNWAGNFAFEAHVVHHPTSVPEVQDLVARSPQVKALGTRHSFTTVADSPEALISLSGLASEIIIDRDAMTATVTGGASYGVLAAELQRRGYALQNMGSLPHISVAGATATGTHGSGDNNGVLATAIAALELVTADGSVVTVDRSNPDLAAIAVGLGAFGVITRVTLDVVPSYTLRQDLYRNASWDSVLHNLDEVMASAYSVSLMADFGSPTIKSVWQKSITESADHPGAAPVFRFGGTWNDDAELPEVHNLNARAGVPGPWSDRLPHFRLDSQPSAGGDELQSEYFVDRQHGAAALDALRGLGDRISPHLGIAEIRTTAADELWMSPAYRQASLTIGFTWKKHPAEVAALLPDIEAALAPYSPRPHWGKLFAIDRSTLSERLARLPEFAALVRRYDPNGKFSNRFLQSIGVHD
ncbi:MAG: FAD-binding protein [Acidimicrobiia bacterium]|nr:FAD-binding protein [Acidimicrobiia bacterium]